MKIGYARVSTTGQDLNIQLGQLQAAGCERLFFEKESGMKDSRVAFNRLLRSLAPGDIVIVPALDRLTRVGPFRMLSVLHEISVRRAAYRSLAEPWVDTSNELGEVLAALQGYVARRSRDDIVRRTRAGRDRAIAKGVKFGRKPKLTVDERREALRRKFSGEPQATIAQAFQVSPSTISRLKAT